MNKIKKAEASLAYWKALVDAKATPEAIAAAKAVLDADIAACSAEEQTMLKTTHAELKDWKAPEAGLEVTLAEIQTAVAKTVNQILAERLPEHKEHLTEEKIKAAVEASVKSQMEKMELRRVLDPSNISNIVSQSLDTALKGIPRPSKMQFGTGGSGEQGKFKGLPEIVPGRTLAWSRETLANRQLCNVILRREMNDGIKDADLKEGEERADYFAKRLHTEKPESIQGIKAITTTGDGTGSEWMPRLLSDVLYERLYLESALARAFLATEVQMESDTYDSPLLTTRPTIYLNNIQVTDPPSSEFGTAKWTLVGQRLMGMLQFSYEANEDSIVPILPTAQRELALAMADAIEDALINGDTTATHMDTGSTVAANDHLRAWKGFRRLTIGVSGLNSDITSGALSRANLLALLKLLKKYGVRTQDLLWIVGPKSWSALLGLDELVNFYQRGSVGSFVAGGPPLAPWGGQIIVSERQREDLNTAGIWDNSTTTKAAITVVNRSGFRMGSRRDIMVEVERKITSQHYNVVASVRKAFAPVETPSATISVAATGYNFVA